MENDFVLPPSMKEGDKIGIVNIGTGPSKTEYPEVYKLGVKRLEKEFGLEPVEYPSLELSKDERLNNMQQLAEELMTAFEDPEIKGVIALIGGTEQVRLIKHLEKDRIQDNPTRFYGYSDNTNLNLYLYNLGIISFYGPSIMTDLGMQGHILEYTKEYARKAFFSDSASQSQKRLFFQSFSL